MRVRWTVSLRIALTVAASFLVAGALLLTVNFALVSSRLPGDELVVRQIPEGVDPAGDGSCAPADCPDVSPRIDTAIVDAARQLRRQTLDELLTQSLWTLLPATVLAAVLGWVIARRAVRPVHAITAAARTISENDLHQRLRVEGPDDELKELADTFDDMLGRLDTAFSAQRRFAAAASHELRTPVAVQRTLLDVTLADPDVDRERLLLMATRLRHLGERQERIIEGLLTLARAGQIRGHRDRCDLAQLTSEAIAAVRADADRRGLRISTALDPAPTTGNAALLGRLAGNLVENAVRHNHDGGVVRATTVLDRDRSRLVLENDGDPLTDVDVERLFEPFHRGGRARVHADQGTGLGLSVARSIAEAHGGTLTLRPRAEGGATVVLELPAASAEPPGSVAGA
ncbi:HAMP domain-containing sensor histidine kinase [Blastococcus sp. TF02A-26]|uniref:sensor histidine kinase n=1 Tax=Blastococcus sp. TF02A-26 TaxID=2250577 RepID=UPI000DE93108|nr:ATP-binding protein [Blastococcus sp. TF02A-26]RBY85176.1 two-component sensor histidine kinase [Blastococcus sp. TF02A-26]